MLYNHLKSLKREELLAYKHITNYSKLTNEQIIDQIIKSEPVYDIIPLLPTKTNQIKKIYHFADIQIRPLARHQEFNEVFENTIAHIKDDKSIPTENKLVVICGDIVEYKDRLTSELIKSLRDFFDKLSKVCWRLVIILGNHDVPPYAGRLDNINPCIDGLSNIIILSNSGAYEIGQYIFAVSAFNDKIVRYHSINNIDKQNKQIIALYHGMINGFKLHNGTVITQGLIGNKVEFKHFDYYDLVLMGDIHLTQVIKKRKTIYAYSGSLIQQNFGEEIDGHGLLEWRFMDNKWDNTFVPIHNNYIYLNLTVKDNKILDNYNPKQIKNKKIRVRYHIYGDYTKDIIEDFELYHDIISSDIRLYGNNVEFKEDLDISFDDISIITSLIPSEMDEKTSQLLLKYHKELRSKYLSTNNEVPYWSIKKVKFENILIYGGNQTNIIDFDDKQGIISITGENAIGKSCILKMILFGLYGKFYEGFKAENIINRYAKTCKLEIDIKYGSSVYKISKKGNLGKKAEFKTKNIEIFKFEGDEFKPANWDDINLGSPNDFLMTNVFSNTINKNFLHLSPADKIKALGRYFRMDFYNDMRKETKEELNKLDKELIYLSGALKTLDNSENINVDELNNLKNKKEKELNKIKNDNEKKINKYKDLNKKKDRLNEKYNPNYTVETDKPSIEYNEKEYYEIKSSIFATDLSQKNVSNDITKLKNKLKKLHKPNIEYEEAVESVIILSNELKNKKIIKKKPDKNILELENELNDLNIMELEVSEDDYKNARTKLKKRVSKISGLKTVEDCLDYIDEEEEYGEYWNKLRVYKNQKRKKELKKMIEEIKIFDKQTELNKMGKIREWYEINNMLNDKVKELELLKENNKNKRKVKELEKARNYCNTLIKKEIEEINKEINEMNIEEIMNRTLEINNEIKSMEYKINECLKNKKEQMKLKREYKVKDKNMEWMKQYNTMINERGVPALLVKERINNIEGYTNEILSRFVNWRVKFCALNDNQGVKLNIEIKKKDQTLGLIDLSGYETFILSICLKMAIWRYSYSGKCRFICIDEGLDCIDKDNFEKVEELFRVLKEQYNSVLLISHIDNVHKYCDSMIEIRRFGEKNEFSKII